MANTEHVELIRRGSHAVGVWRGSHRAYGLDLSGATLRGLDLRGVDLGGTERSRSNLSGADLTDADLTGADLQSAVLIGSTLNGCRFDGANLERAYLNAASIRPAGEPGDQYVHRTYPPRTSVRPASFVDARLKWADLRNARFDRTRLDGADLTAADLGGTQLFRATMDGTKVGDSKWIGTVLCAVDLTAVVGLAATIHFGPSHIDVDTLLRSAHLMPDAFMRGIGVSEGMIRYLKQSSEVTIGFRSCFISYSHADHIFAGRLHDALQSRGVRCWRDEKDIRPGERILDAVAGGIETHDAVLLCCSKDALSSWWVRDEVEKAIERERRERRQLIIPLLLDDRIFDWESGLRSAITSRLGVDFRGWSTDAGTFDRQIARLAKSLETTVG